METASHTGHCLVNILPYVVYMSKSARVVKIGQNVQQLGRYFHIYIYFLSGHSDSILNLSSQGNYITYDGDPLNDFTIIRFFDHFIHKNPKQRKGDHGGSIMQVR